MKPKRYYQNDPAVQPPPPFLRALTRSDYSKGKSDFSVTQLISPPQRTWLAESHEEAEKSIYASYASMMGTAMHNVLENNLDEEAGEIAEERYFMEFNDVIVSGQLDLYANNTIYDYKFTGGTQDHVKPDHYKQAQMNGYLAEHNGVEVDYCSIQYIQRDWSFMRSQFSPDYAPTPFKQFSFTYNQEEALMLFQTTTAEHKAARDGSPRECTAEERWQDPTRYAVKKPANKRARKVFDTHQEAKDNLKSGELIEERPSTPIYCEHFCGYSHCCPQYKKLK